MATTAVSAPGNLFWEIISQKKWLKNLHIKKKQYLCNRKTKNAQVAELVDAHVSGACAARCAGSSPALGTTEGR